MLLGLKLHKRKGSIISMVVCYDQAGHGEEGNLLYY